MPQSTTPKPSTNYSRGQFIGVGPKHYQRSDDRILEDANEALTQHPDIDASEIEVSIKNGILTLSGTISTRHMKQAAEKCVSKLAGVKSVRNDLRIDTTKITKLQTSETSAEEALSRSVRKP